MALVLYASNLTKDKDTHQYHMASCNLSSKLFKLITSQVKLSVLKQRYTLFCSKHLTDMCVKMYDMTHEKKERI